MRIKFPPTIDAPLIFSALFFPLKRNCSSALTGFDKPIELPLFFQLFNKPLGQLNKVTNIVEGIRLHFLGQRPLTPIRFLGLFGKFDPKILFEKTGQPKSFNPKQSGRGLGVPDRFRNPAVGPSEHRHVIVGSVHPNDVGCIEKIDKRFHTILVDGKRVDNCHRTFNSKLNKTQFCLIRMHRISLGINRAPLWDPVICRNQFIEIGGKFAGGLDVVLRLRESRVVRRFR